MTKCALNLDLMRTNKVQFGTEYGALVLICYKNSSVPLDGAVPAATNSIQLKKIGANKVPVIRIKVL